MTMNIMIFSKCGGNCIQFMCKNNIIVCNIMIDTQSLIFFLSCIIKFVFIKYFLQCTVLYFPQLPLSPFEHIFRVRYLRRLNEEK